MLSEEIKFNANILKSMCDQNKDVNSIKKYIEHIDKNLISQALNLEYCKIEQDLKTSIKFKGSGNIHGDIVLVIDKPSDLMYNNNEDEEVTNLINSLLNNASAKINPIFDISNIYLTYFEKTQDVGLNMKLVNEEINSLVEPKAVICMGSTSCGLLIKKDYQVDDNTVYGDSIKYIGTYSPVKIIKAKDISKYKRNIWCKFVTVSNALSDN